VLEVRVKTQDEDPNPNNGVVINLAMGPTTNRFEVSFTKGAGGTCPNESITPINT